MTSRDTNIILQSRTIRPVPHNNTLVRERLITAPDNLAGRKVTYVYGPSGCGKTVLINQWYNKYISADWKVAWLTLDEEDNHQDTLLSHLYVALTRACEDSPEHAELLETYIRNGQTTRETCVEFLNCLSQNQGQILIILDGLEKISNASTLDDMHYLIKHLPHNTHFLIASRKNCPWPTAAFMIAGEMLSYNWVDLRFTENDLVNLFSQTTDTPPLSTDTVSKIIHETDGWAAAAKLAIQNSIAGKNSQRFLSTELSYRYIEETTYQELEEPKKQLLLIACLFSEFCLELLEFITPSLQPDTILQSLEQDGLFIQRVNRPEKYGWYKLSPIFQGFLLTKLNDTADPDAGSAHELASEWFEDNNLLFKALEHALSARSYQRSLRLLLDIVYDAIFTGQIETLLGWLETLTTKNFAQHTQALIIFAWAYYLTGKTEETARLIPKAKEALRQERTSNSNSDTQLLEEYSQHIQLFEAISHRQYPKPYHLLEKLRGIRKQLRPSSALLIGLIEGIIGKQFLITGEVKTAATHYRSAQVHSSAAANQYAAVNAACGYASALHLQGENTLAEQTCNEAITLIEQSKTELSVISALPKMQLAEMSYDTNNLSQTQELLDDVSGYAAQLSDPALIRHHKLLSAQVICADTGLTQALSYLKDARDDLKTISKAHTLKGLAALEAFWLTQTGDIDGAAATLETIGIPTTDGSFNRLGEPAFWDEDAYISLIYWLIVQNRAAAANPILKRLERLASNQNRVLSQLKITCLLGLIASRSDTMEDNSKVMVRLMKLGSQCRSARTILDFGEPMVLLIKDFITRENFLTTPIDELSEEESYLRSLLDNTSLAQKGNSKLATFDRQSTQAQNVLTPREWDIMKLVEQGYTNHDVSESLRITPNTVNWHLRNIYSKLDVHTRLQATTAIKNLSWH